MCNVKIICEPFLEDCRVKILENEYGVKIYRTSLKPPLTNEALAERINSAKAIIINVNTPINKNLLKKCNNLKRIISFSSGINHIDIEACQKNDIEIVYCKSYCATSIAEKIMGYILMAKNRFIPAVLSVKNGEWNQNFQGSELFDKTICVFGVGEIGEKVVSLCKAFGMHVICINSKSSANDIEYGLGKADIINLNMPLNNKTKHFLNEDRLKLVKNNVLIVNTSRGGIINEKALFDFLIVNRKATAVLDVLEKEPLTDNPLSDLENVIITPHIAWNSDESCRKLKNFIFNEAIRACEDFS
ncbi:MAG TPA: NAD(P)-dependent oxidoreductase [Victivallales bacterium]|nr:NAD(P)-dependent oxidoreductase [Victivallales bacterium]